MKFRTKKHNSIIIGDIYELQKTGLLLDCVGKVINKRGKIIYHRYGEWHREDGPAYILPNGNSHYYLNDRLFSEQQYKFEMKSKLY